MKFVNIIICLIILLGALLRFVNLSNNPPSLNWDEVSFGYNAHSIIETGKDEFGKTYPLYFRSLDDYKLPVYTYMTVLSEKIFGYNNFAVRFPSAFFGTLTIFLVYLLSLQLLKNKMISILSALLFAILPWHIQFSRMAAEATVGLFFFVLGLLFLLYGFSKRKWFLLLSFFAFAIAAYTYLGFRFIVPMVILLLAIYYYKHIFKKSIFVYITGIFVIIFGLLVIYDSYINRNTSRTTGIAAVTPLTRQYQQDVSELIYDGHLRINIPRRILHDSHIFSTIDILASNYLSHFSPTFLFFDFGQTRHYTPMTGLLYLWMLPFMLFGVYFLFNQYKQSSAVVASLILLTPIPAAFAFDSPNAIRTVALAVPFCILTAIGIYKLGMFLRSRPIFLVFYCAFIIALISFSLFRFYHQNFIHLPHERSSQWQYGRKEMALYLLKHKNDYDRIIISTKLEWPNIFYLYYSKYDPAEYLKQGGTMSGSWNAEDNKLDNFEFHRFRFPMENVPASKKKVLFVGAPDEFPQGVVPVYKINYLDGSPAIFMVRGGESIVIK